MFDTEVKAIQDYLYYPSLVQVSIHGAPFSFQYSVKRNLNPFPNGLHFLSPNNYTCPHIIQYTFAKVYNFL